ncbi:MAG: glycerol-3-phosphate 1-O-acyltransferase PlsY [Roseibium sp.]|uniref:glycerol-3-phosphate 1-O-acyltransferase PlsY n=1 Tax=Roseibium sp. TaxID=1936156 RepID=UPI003D9C1344
MLMVVDCCLAVLVGYLLGSIPTGYLAGRLKENIDIREHGSRSTGATNVLRTLGPSAAIIVLCVDFLKGFAAVLIADRMSPLLLSIWESAQPTATDANVLIALAGSAALLGHSRSIWLKFSGGKSAATGLGVLCAMSIPIGLGTAFAFVITLFAFRIVSLSSLVAALAAVVLVNAFAEPLPFRILVVLGATYVFVLHRMNIHRMLNGLEPRIGRRTFE